MAQNRWLARALAVAEVKQFTVTAADVATTYKVTLNTKVLNITGLATPALTAAAIVAAWNAASSTYAPEFKVATATLSTATIIVTHNTPGRPIGTFTATVTGGTGTVSAITTTTAGTGPNYWSNLNNWSLGTVPVSTNDVFVDGRDTQASILFGIAQSAVTLASINIAANYRGDIGLSEVNVSSTAPYTEHLDQYLAISANTADIGYGPGQGSGRLKINFGTNKVIGTVRSTGQGAEEGIPAMLFLGTHTDNELYVEAGSVGIATAGTQTSTLLIGFAGRNATVRMGKGVTLGTFSMVGGDVQIENGATAITKDDGVLTILEGAVGTLKNRRGGVYLLGTGTITTLLSGGLVSFGIDGRAITVTNSTFSLGASIDDPKGRVTWTNPALFYECDPGEIPFRLGSGRKLAITF